MPGIIKLGDFCSGHGCFPPRIGVTVSPNVFATTIPLHRFSDALTSHCCPDNGCHSGIYIGSHTVFSNALPLQIDNDPISCGSKCVSTTSTVIVE